MGVRFRTSDEEKAEKDAQKMGAITDSAAEWLESGHELYVVTLLFVMLPRWAETIEAIERAGWRLEHFAPIEAGNAVAVFRAANPYKGVR